MPPFRAKTKNCYGTISPFSLLLLDTQEKVDRCLRKHGLSWNLTVEAWQAGRMTGVSLSLASHLC